MPPDPAHGIAMAVNIEEILILLITPFNMWTHLIL